MEKFAFYIVLFVCCSCSLDFPPEDEVSDPDAITSITAGQRALANAYASYNEYNYALDFVALSDDMQPTPLLAKNIGLKNMYHWRGKELELLAETVWQGHYTTIANLNVLLERLQKLKVGSSEKVILQNLQAKANYLKALCYFQLLKIFSPSFSQNDTNAKGILQKEHFVLTENQERVSLSESVKILQKLLEKQENADDDTQWLTSDCAKYLQAEIALWAGEYSRVIEIALPLYQQYLPILEEQNPAMIWTNTENKLRLFAVDITYFNRRIYDNLEYDAKVGDYLEVAKAIAYEENDVRKEVYAVPFKQNLGKGAKISWHLGKYRKQGSSGVVNYYTKFRVAGLVFLCAEAYVKLGELQKATAILNHFLALRKSALVPTTLNQKELLDRVLSEKQREFVGEPERFFDLKRNHKTLTKKTSLSAFTIKADDYRWTLPIPASEIKHNKGISQNKGWEYINR